MTTHRQKCLYNALKADFLFSFKHGFYYIYIVITLLYIAILSLFGDQVIRTMLPILLYTDPSALGLFFIGGMVMLEKQQGILSLLHITPMRTRAYLGAKLASLCLISVLASIAIALLGTTLPINFFWLVLGISLTSVFFTLIGFLIAMSTQSVNDYFVKMIPWMVLLILPCISLIPNTFLPAFASNVLCLIPSVAGLKLVFAALSPGSLFQIALSCSSLIIINVLLFLKASTIFEQKTIAES